MKCYQIRTRLQGDTPFFPNMLNNSKVEVCLKEDVDAAISELQDENAQLKKEIEFMHSNCKWDAGDGCARLLGEKLAIIDENVKLKQKLEDVNELIKTARQMLEDAKATHYAEMVDAGMRERRLRRALYKACANWAYWVDHALTTKLLYNNSSITKLERDRWYNMEHKCLKKAEEYK